MFPGKRKRIAWLLSLCFLLCLGSCKQKTEPKNNTPNDTNKLTLDAKFEVSTEREDSIHSNFVLADFLTENNLNVQYLDSGFINHDSLVDQVIVLQEISEERKYLPRVTVILLGREHGLMLHEKSKIVMPQEYTSDGNQQFDTEEVRIEDGKVIFDLYALGPNGHIYFDYLWKDGGLQLHELTTYFMGAGSHTSFSYIASNENEGIVKQTIVNTMEEIPSETSESLPIRFKSSTKFEHFNYQDCLQEIITLPFSNE